MIHKFTTLGVQRVLGIERARLREWVNSKYVTACMPSLGQGEAALFSRTDLHYIELFRRLVDFGVSRDVAKKALEKFAYMDTDKVQGISILDKLIIFDESKGVGIYVDIQKIIEFVDKNIEKYYA